MFCRLILMLAVSAIPFVAQGGAAVPEPVPRFADSTPNPAVVAQDAQTIERGEQILNQRCSTTCHDLRPVDVQALDEAGWTKAIASMIEKGAKVSAEDRPVLRDYLVKSHGPLPDGPGKQVLLNTCTLCHDLQRVRRQRNSTEGWAETLEAMLSEGAPLSAEDLPVLLRYLARNFGPE